MDYYESVVMQYLRADRSIFLNTEYCLQLNEAENPDTSGPHWYCDAVALDFRSKEILLCEISYAARLNDLINRLKGWNDNWQGVCDAVVRDSSLALLWPVRPWLFVPQESESLLNQRLEKIANGQELKFKAKITHLEKVQPWRYCSWNRKSECEGSRPGS